MTRFAAYDTQTGRIDHLRESDLTRMQFHTLPAGHQFVEYEGDDVSSETHFVSDGIVVERQAMTGIEHEYSIPADAVASVELTLPPGTIVQFEGADYAGEEAFRFSSDIPGSYQFRFIPPAERRDIEVTIHAI